MCFVYFVCVKSEWCDVFCINKKKKKSKNLICFIWHYIIIVTKCLRCLYLQTGSNEYLTEQEII